MKKCTSSWITRILGDAKIWIGGGGGYGEEFLEQTGEWITYTRIMDGPMSGWSYWYLHVIFLKEWATWIVETRQEGLEKKL